MSWIRVPYPLDSRDLSTVWIAPVDSRRPPADGWLPAYRDTMSDGTTVVQVRGEPMRRVWLYDAAGPRQEVTL